MSFAVIIFFVSLAGIVFIIGRQFIVHATAGSNAMPVEMRQESDIAYVFSPAVLFVKQKGILKKITSACGVLALAVRFSIVMVYKRARKAVLSKIAEMTRHLHEKEGNTKEKGAASFFLKDIAEHKKQINKDSPLDPFE